MTVKLTKVQSVVEQVKAEMKLLVNLQLSS